LKKDTSLNYDGFEIEFNRNIYQLLEIVQTMVSFEAGLGDTPISLYMSAIPGLTVETETYSDGTEVYTLEDKYNNVFSFASRSRVFPAGYLPMEEEENIDYYENNEDVDRDTILDRKGGDETLH
jgi:hypothetical protein